MVYNSRLPEKQNADIAVRVSQDFRLNLPVIAATATIPTTIATTAATTATTATAAARTSAAAASAETAAATAATTKSAAFSLRTRLIHCQLTAVECAAVQLRHRRIGFAVIRHLDERKPAGLAAVAITHDVYRVDRTELRKRRAQGLFVSMEAHVAHVNILHGHLFTFFERRVQSTHGVGRQSRNNERKRYTGREQIAG